MSLEHAMAEARDFGILGGEREFDIEVFVGHGSYVCGEESALLLSIEGRRPEVMARPPYPTERGLFGKPTVTNNVETFANVPWIVRHGGEAYHVARLFQEPRHEGGVAQLAFQPPRTV